MVKCKDIKELLPPYLDDFLEPGKKKVVEEHLSSCPQCSKELADLKKAMRMLQEIEEVDTPPYFEQQIMARVRQKEAVKKDAGLLKKIFFPLYVKIPMQAFAMVLVAVIAVYLYKSAGPEATSVRPESTPVKSAEQPSTPSIGNISSPKGTEGKHTGTLSDKTFPGNQSQKRTSPSDIKTGTTVKENRSVSKEENLIRPRLPQENTQQLTASTSPVLPQIEGKGLNPVITLTPDDASSASKEIERLLSNAGARIIERKYSDIKETLTVEMEQNKLNNFIGKLKALGQVEIKDMPADSIKEMIIFRLNIIEK